MTNTKKLLGAAAFSLALAGGGAAGILLGSPATSGAQEEATTDTSIDSSPAGWHRHRPGPFAEHLAAAADALGISTDDLRAALEDGKSIADVAAEQGVDLDTVIDALVADATDELRDRITAMVNGELPPRFEHRFGPGPGLEAAADALGVSTGDLRAALRDGKSIADVAGEQGIDVQAVIDALVAEANERIDARVAGGDLTEERAAEIKADLEEHVADLVNHDGGLRQGPHHGENA